jgi:hypothetical protein
MNGARQAHQAGNGRGAQQKMNLLSHSKESRLYLVSANNNHVEIQVRNDGSSYFKTLYRPRTHTCHLILLLESICNSLYENQPQSAMTLKKETDRARTTQSAVCWGPTEGSITLCGRKTKGIPTIWVRNRGKLVRTKVTSSFLECPWFILSYIKESLIFLALWSG